MLHKLLTILISCSLCSWASATSKPSSPPPSPSTSVYSSSSADSQAASQASAAATGYGGNAAAYGGTGGQGFGGASSAAGGSASLSDASRFYVLPAPVPGVALPSGMCASSKSSSFAIGWNFFSVANADSHTDMECLKLLVDLTVMRASLPPPQPEPRLPPLTKADLDELKAAIAAGEARKACEARKPAAKPAKRPARKCTP